MEEKEKLLEIIKFLRTHEQIESIHLNCRLEIKPEDENWESAEIGGDTEVSFTFKSKG